MPVTNIVEAKQKLFRALLHMTNSGEPNTAGFTRWHQRRAAENARMRHRLNDRFTALANYQDASRQINLP